MARISTENGWEGITLKKGIPRRVKAGILIVSVILLVVGIIGLVRYYQDWNDVRQETGKLRSIREEMERMLTISSVEPSPTPSCEPVPTPYASPDITAPATETVEAAAAETTEMPEVSPTPVPKLGEIAYPNNPGRTVSATFKALRKEQRDIVAWLTIGKMLDEPVVQRNNEYYMDHDVSGNPNVNGAIFLDESVSLKTRPYTLILYGHNMKSGAMFGSLRNYENISFYHSYPFITCDTLYETGRYVVFSACTVSTEETASGYLDFYALNSRGIRQREQAIETLRNTSVHTCTVDIRPDDQLLVLVTCVDQDSERRIVAARRIRDGETEDELMAAVRQSKKKR